MWVEIFARRYETFRLMRLYCVPHEQALGSPRVECDDA
jgi:hypothetical protein